MLRLPDLVGRPLSLSSLARNARVSPTTAKSWTTLLEDHYYVFLAPPFTPSGARALTESRKHYHFDWSVVGSPSARFENFVASHLLKWVHFRQDTEGLDTELCYFRNRDGRGVDFVVTRERRPILLVACSVSDDPISRSLAWLKWRYPGARAVQVFLDGCPGAPRRGTFIETLPAVDFLAELV